MDTGQILAEILVGGEMRIHLLGVAGSGMSGIAGLLLALGHRVSGSDKVTTIEVERLQKLGLEFHPSQDTTAVAGADLIIYSSAIRPGNPGYDEAVRTGKSMVRRADAVAAVLNCKRGIIVAGMHGKTTTSSMAAHVLRGGGLKPSHYVGAEIPILGTNAHWDAEGELFVAEGDESDGTLANYHPEYAIILNIEEEHLDYYENLEAIEAVFRQLLDQTSGSVFYCADDPHAARLCGSHPRAVSFGSSGDARFRFENLVMENFQSKFDVVRGGEKLGSVTLNVPGKHNVTNALGVIALADELGIEFGRIAAALESFRGARRRFEIKYRSERFVIVDDYAHHPSEIRATLATARTAGRKRIVTLFQPHRYSRTALLMEEFGRAFHDSALVFVTGIYAASEKPMEGVTGQTLVDAMTADGHKGAHFRQDRVEAIRELGRLLEPGDFILSLGAGDIHEQAATLAADLKLLEEIEAVAGPGLFRLYEPLAKHTTLRVGGPAQFWVEPETEEGFARLVAYCSGNDVPLMVMGRGSNLLVRDGGIRGVVAHLVRGEFRKLEVAQRRIVAGAGLKLKELSHAARDAGIGGLEWMEGIPGNVGGSLRMNAGAMGMATFDNVVSVRCVDREGAFHTKVPRRARRPLPRCPFAQDELRRRRHFRGPREHPAGDRPPAGSLHAQAPFEPAGRLERGVHLQEPRGLPRREACGRTRLEKSPRRQGAGFRSPRQLHRQRRRRGGVGRSGIDRPHQSHRFEGARRHLGNGSSDRGPAGMMDTLLHKKIAVLKGGPGSERPVSLASAAGVSKALRGLGADVVEIDVKNADFTLPDGVALAFNIIHGVFGEDGELQRVLDATGIPYTGEGAAGSRLAFDKIETKERFAANGIPTPKYEILSIGQKPSMPLPYVVKAPRQGSTVGVYIVREEAEIEPALQGASQYDDRLLVEKYIPGRELTVGILGDAALPILQIVPKSGFYDFNDKYPFLNPQGGGGAEHLCPAPLSPGETRCIQGIALAAHRALGLEVYSRVDFILTEAGEPFVLEINTIPGMTEASLLPEAAGVAGISYPALCQKIIELSLAKGGRR